MYHHMHICEYVCVCVFAIECITKKTSLEPACPLRTRPFQIRSLEVKKIPSLEEGQASIAVLSLFFLLLCLCDPQLCSPHSYRIVAIYGLL